MSDKIIKSCRVFFALVVLLSLVGSPPIYSGEDSQNALLKDFEWPKELHKHSHGETSDRPTWEAGFPISRPWMQTSVS